MISESGSYWCVHPLGGRTHRRRHVTRAAAEAVRDLLPYPAAVVQFNRYGKIVMSRPEPSIENYLATLNEDLQNGLAYDHVASLDEWRMFKKALALWVEQQEREWDDIARNAEHGIDP